MHKPGDLGQVRNRVMLATRPQAQEFLLANSEIRPLRAGTVLYEQDTPFTHAVLPHSGVLSVLAGMENGKTVEKASIGNEGLVGFTYLMGGGAALGRTIVQVEGHATWLSMQALDEAMARFECVREAMLRYAQSLIVSLMESVVCNSLHTAEQRVARWLLTADDRMNGAQFKLTQEAIAQLLGVRRATVSEVCSNLMAAGVLTYRRGQVEILDRDILQRYSCECYARARAGQI